MKLILISTFFILQIAGARIHAADSAQNKPKSTPNQKPAVKTATASTVATSPNAAPRELKENEYTLAQDNKIKIIKTRLYEGLLLSEDCFKKATAAASATAKKPHCTAYSKSLQKTPIRAEDATESPYHNNLGSIHCKLLGGTGLIVKSSQGNESDFCQFKDGSMVSSWSAYYKTTSQNQKPE